MNFRLSLLLFMVLLPMGIALGWLSGIQRWPPSDQLIAWVRQRPTRPQQREMILLDVRPSQVTFVGDSITAEGLWSEYFDPALTVANRGFPGATSAALLDQLPAITATRAQRYLLMAGANDVLYAPWGPENTVSTLLRLRQRLLDSAPGTRVVVQSTLECLPPLCPPQALQRIRAINRSLSQKLPGPAYLDINTVLSTASGLNPAFTHDGVHLNAKGYAAWRSLLQPQLQRWLQR